MRQTSVYCIECLCGRHIETESAELNCPTCGGKLRIEWDAEAKAPESKPEPKSIPAASLSTARLEEKSIGGERESLESAVAFCGDYRNGKNGAVPIDALRDASAPLNLVGSALSNADFIALEARWVNRELAKAAFLRRVDSFTGAQLVGRKGGDYSGIVIPYFSPGSAYVREYRLRRDHPNFEAGANGELRVKQKYLSPPGRGNMLYVPPGVIPLCCARLRCR